MQCSGVARVTFIAFEQLVMTKDVDKRARVMRQQTGGNRQLFASLQC